MCDKVKTNPGQPTGLKYALDKDSLSLGAAFSPHPIVVWTTPAQTLFYVVFSHPSAASLKGWAHSCWPHGHGCHGKFGNSQKGGGQNVSCDFGGGKRTIKHHLQNQFWRPQKVGFVWSVPVSSKENDIAWTKGGGNRIISGGVQNRFWGGDLWYVFPSLEFPPPPLCFLWWMDLS